jgi:hypothetical protein
VKRAAIEIYKRRRAVIYDGLSIRKGSVMATREELMLVVDAIRGCYAGQLVNVDAKSMLSAYTAVLGELDGVDLWNAAKGIMRKFKMAPTPADIREEVLRLTVGELRSPVDAWRDVINAVGRYGSNDPVFNDPGVASCVQQLGWTNIRMGKEDAMRDAFCNLYKECARREKAKVPQTPNPKPQTPNPKIIIQSMIIVVICNI